MAPTARDWKSHFGIENIPFGIAKSIKHPRPQAVSRYENTVIFLADLVESVPQLKSLPSQVFEEPSLNLFAGLGRSAHQNVRSAIQELIKKDDLPPGSTEDLEDVHMYLPVSVGDFTDFSCSEYHNLNAGHAVTGRRALPPTWGIIPPGYAGRCSSLVVSGTPVQRPIGQYWEDTAAAMKGENMNIIYGPCKNMDFELELGAIIGKPVGQGESVTAHDAGGHIFGFVIVNDWSARDIQTFEMIPLGPLNSKNSATTLSPWVITFDALEPFRTVGRTSFDRVAPHLKQANDRALSVELEVKLTSKKEDSTNEKNDGDTICRCNSSVMAWSFEQLIAHQASAGCGLRPGDLVAIGTVSEEEDGKRGCLLEDNIPALGRSRGFLKDGDLVEFSAYCGDGVGFGDCKGQLLPALSGDLCRVGS